MKTLIEIGHVPVLLLTLPIERQSRHSDFVDLGVLAAAAGIAVTRVDDVNDPSVLSALSDVGLDLLFVVGWSRICGPELRRLARVGTLGYHPTLLPKMRGRAALAWTILLNTERTGGTIFWLDDGMDSGDIAAQEEFDLTGEEDVQDLMDLQLKALASMIPPLFARLCRGETPSRPQNHEAATYLAIRRASDGEVDWNLPAPAIACLVRAVTRPYPGAFTALGNRTLRIWSSRVVNYPQWHAQVGQVFTRDENGAPIVRCGGRTDLALVDYELESNGQASVDQASEITGQPRLGISK